jgi:hypothetical protein
VIGAITSFVEASTGEGVARLWHGPVSEWIGYLTSETPELRPQEQQ